MKILLTNDDGYKAKGINDLFESLHNKFDVTMIAPDRERSSCGHAITLTKALRLNEFAPHQYQCTGFPADCVLIGVGHLFKNEKIDLIISGPNHGANLGQDRFYSGTMAAAREGAFRGVKSISISLVMSHFERDINFDVCKHYISKLIENNINTYIPKGAILNINVPNLPLSQIKGVRYTSPGVQKYTEDVMEREDFRGSKYYWVGGRYDGYEPIEGSDCNAIYEGFISVDLQYISVINDDVDEEKVKEIIDCL